MTDVDALARYVHQLHHQLGKLLTRELSDQTDCYYVPTEGGLLWEYLHQVDELGERFNAREDRDRFYASQDQGTDE
jgi:hypothetical protein